jgi:hypothetical protein
MLTSPDFVSESIPTRWYRVPIWNALYLIAKE